MILAGSSARLLRYLVHWLLRLCLGFQGRKILVLDVSFGKVFTELPLAFFLQLLAAEFSGHFVISNLNYYAMY